MSMMTNLLEKIEQKNATVGVIGLGYVGLPLALAFAEKGMPVIGFDIDPKKYDLLNSGKSYIKYIAAERIADVVEKKVFSATDDFNRLPEADVLIICLPTPLDEHMEPDMSFIENNAKLISTHLKKGQLIILESTTYPGTTEELLADILEESGMIRGEDFFLAFSPEREDPGSKHFSTTTIPKVVGGTDPASGQLAVALYDTIISKTVPVSSAAVAEATKLTENIFRAVNIALVNELKIIYDKMGINVWEVLDAAETKPFGFMRFNPGPGWGGHCIPIDPFYLTWKAKELGLTTRFIELAGQVNITMPNWVINKLQLELNNHRKPVNGSKILLLGMAYKKDIDDVRESPALVILDMLFDLGAKVDYHDPFVDSIPMTRAHPQRAGMKSVELSPGNIADYDAILLVTDHSDLDYKTIVENAQLFIDTRGVIHNKYPELAGKVVMA
jgi:UDP-N-acetyl-D-glucosamine dehydrogenase